MHQTFYIDIDEEITSVVERLRGANSEEAVLVVPKRALLIQSIVNLRLLKKEADSIGIAISIVTQDNLGKILVEKAGIAVQAKLEDSEDEEIPGYSENRQESAFVNNPIQEASESLDQPKSRIDQIGSDSFFERSQAKESKVTKEDLVAAAKEKSKKIASEQGKAERILNKELVLGIGDDMKKKTGYGNMDLAAPASFPNQPVSLDIPPKSQTPGFSLDSRPDLSGFKKETDKKTEPAFSGDRKIDSFFNHQSQPSPYEFKRDVKNANLSGRVRKVFLGFGFIVILVILGAAAYLFLPKATVMVGVRAKEKSQDIEVKADLKVEAVDAEAGIIPAKSISETVEASYTASSSGSKNGSSTNKARGTISIYNEYSSEEQPLVATTRFETEDGKIFRLEKGVTVPGTSTVSGETKPGVIEATVIADQPGESYNIAPTKFTIPGFKGSGNDKYSKIYAKSSQPMTGGGGGNSENGIKAVSESDITAAKNKVLADLKSAAKDKVRSSASGMVVLDDAINYEEATYSLSNSAGEAVEKFEVKGQLKVSAIAFSESDLKDVASKIIARSGNGKMTLDSSSVKLTYGKADVDFKMGTMSVKANASIPVSLDIDAENLKKGILGKTKDELEAYLSTYSDIEKAEVIYWPTFMNGKIPFYEKRVEVIVSAVEDKK